MFYSTGTLKYFENPYKLIVEVDPEISNYYRSLVPKYIKINKQLFDPHISVVRKETPLNLSFWRKYEAIELPFEYDSFVYFDELYCWLNAYSKELENIRTELGLTSTSPITRSPDGRHKFHITLGNFKN